MSVVPARDSAPVTQTSAEVSALLDDLDESQRAAVTHQSPLLAILAPAGSGKTRVLTRRMAWLIATGRAEPSRVLAVTFTRKAAGELRSRLSSAGAGAVTAGTFHSLALAMLRRRATERGRDFPAVLDRKGRILGPMLGRRGAGAVLDINDVASEIEWAKARTITPDRYAEEAEREQRRPSRPMTEIGQIYERYEQEKRRRGFVDFDDLLWWTAEAFAKDPAFAAAQRFRFRHFFVDEFQDVTPSQLRVLRAWLSDRRDVTVVGDDAQAIYGFAGAQPGALTGFDRLFPGAAMIRLSTNYRSTPQIVAVTHAALGESSGIRRPRPLAPRPPGPAPTVRAYDDDEAEANAVVGAIAALAHAGRAWHSFAVLYRTNAQSAQFEAACTRAGVPVRLRGASRFLERAEVRAAFEMMRETEQQSPGRPLSDHLADLLDAGRETEHDEEREHFDALARLAAEYLAIDGGRGTLAAFRGWLEAATRGDDVLAGDAVELSTFHAAKGLEWPVVFVTGAENGLVPIGYARTHETRAEEQRLFHVALSRAETELHVSWARRRAGKPRRPSPWLGPIEEVIVGGRPAPPVASADRRDRLADTRRALRAARPEGVADVDRELLEALKLWLLTHARAHDLPAFTIFHDATLEEIATSRPCSTGDLLAVHGVGDTKLSRYGEDVLRIVREHANGDSA
jgi:DNA helicase-2/ATP-dependent DNA helicase PcrA